MRKPKRTTVEAILACATHSVDTGESLWVCLLCPDEPVFSYVTEIEDHLFDEHKYTVRESAFTEDVLVHHISISCKG